MAGWLHGERQTPLNRVPVHNDPGRVPPHGLDECLRQPSLVHATCGGAILSRSRHAPTNPQLTIYAKLRETLLNFRIANSLYSSVAYGCYKHVFSGLEKPCNIKPRS